MDGVQALGGVLVCPRPRGARHGATHSETVPIRETFGRDVVWDGAVEVFDLEDHPTAKRCYAWAHEADSGGRRFLVVLHVPPIDSPRKAVQAAIIAEHRGKTGGPRQTWRRGLADRRRKRERRSNKLEVPLTPEERREVNAAAKLAGIESVSEWARDVLLEPSRHPK